MAEGHDLGAIDRGWSALDVVLAGEALDAQADAEAAIAEARRLEYEARRSEDG